MEKKFLQILKYNMKVPLQVYAEYYFELRSLAKNSENEYPLKPLSKRKEFSDLKIFQDGLLKPVEADKLYESI